MSEIVKRFWREPAVAIGVIVAVAELVIKFITGDPWDTVTITALVAPIAAALGIRQYVTPVSQGNKGDTSK